MARQRIDLSSTVSIFKQSFSSCSSNLLPFFFVSLLLFSFRLSLERGTIVLSSFLDQQSSVQSLFPSSPSPSNNSPETSSSSSQPYSPPSSSGDPPEDAVSRKAAGARRAFVIFTRGGTLDDDFLADEPSSYSRRRHHHRSSGMGFPWWDSSVSLNVTPFLMRSIPAADLQFPNEVGGGEEEREIHAIVESSSLLLVSDQVSGRNEVNRTRVEILGRKDAAVLAMLLIGMSAAFGWLLLGFLFLHSFSCGIVFFSVANAYLGKNVSVMRALCDAFKHGVHRLTVFVLFRWALREVLTQFLSLCFFSAMKDEYALIRLVVRLKLVPFSVTLPMANEISLPFSNEVSNGGAEVSMKILGFLLSWYMVDMFISFLHNIDCWVALTDSRPSVLDAVREGCRLTCMMWSQAVWIKFWESLFCGLCVRWVLAKLGGDNFSSFFQSLAETYFLVVWLVFYFAAKSRATAGQWGHKELEDCLDSLR